MDEEERAPTTTTTDDAFRTSSAARLAEAAASGKFFKSNGARLLPSFDRAAAPSSSGSGAGGSDGDELALGAKLGEGAFCEVREIAAVVLRRGSDDGGDGGGDDEGNGAFLPPARPSEGLTEEADFPVGLLGTRAEIRAYMAENCVRKEGGARYALKILKPTDSRKRLERGLLDLSIEAQFLACLDHPSVIKMRGVAGEALSPEFGIVLDRLYMTLEDKMDRWTEEKNVAASNGCACFRSVDAAERERLALAAVTVAYDLSCALRYIHGQNLVYRDIKPENAGFDVRGNIKLFDFGFCKELTQKLLDKPSGLYKLTKMTGSPPYMAPENFLGKPYGKSADVFSFGVLVWEMLHCKFAFYQYNAQDYKDVVVERNYRPPIDGSLSTRTKEFLKEAWDRDPGKRPTFDRTSLLLRAEHQELSTEDFGGGGSTRSQRMLGASVRSIRALRKK